MSDQQESNNQDNNKVDAGEINVKDVVLDGSKSYLVTIKNTCLKLFTKNGDNFEDASGENINIRIDVGKFVKDGSTNEYVTFDKLKEGDKQLFIDVANIEKIEVVEQKTDGGSKNGGASKRRLSKKAKHARRGRRSSRKSL